MASGVTRRRFLKIGAAGLTSAVLAGCQSPRRWVELEPYVRPPEEELAGVPTWFASTCRQCPAGCGIIVRVMNGRALKLEGNPQHPLNRGKLCARGQAGLQLLYNPDRLAGPVRQAQRGSRQFEALGWNEALQTLHDALDSAGGGIAAWLGTTTSGHVYDLFQRLTSALGAPQPVVFDLYGALNGYPALAGDQGVLPGYPLGQADVVLSFGANLLGAGPSAVRYGIEYGDMRSQALGQRGYVAQLEPRMSLTGAIADRWLPLRPGSEGLVAAALLRLIADQGLGGDRADRAANLAADVDVGQVAQESELTTAQLQELAGMFAGAGRPLAIPGGALDAAAIAAALRPPVSTYAAARDLVARMSAGDVQVLLVHGANPAYDVPLDAGLAEALGKVPTVVSFAPLVDETAVQADLILPDRTYLESWGYDVASPNFGLPIVGSQQPVVSPVFDARSTADVLLTVGQGMSAAAAQMPWNDEVAMLQEMVAGLGPGQAGGSGDAVLWARFLQHGGWWPASPPAPAIVSAPAQPAAVALPHDQGQADQYPYHLHIYLSDLLAAGGGASQPWLQGSPDPMTTMAWQTWVEVHPATARDLAIQDGAVVRVTSPYGSLELPVYVYPAIRPDTVAIPSGQGHTDLGRYARGRGDHVLKLLSAQTRAGAETGTGGGLAWSNLRVRVEPTGRQAAMARFEDRVGVTEGFINQGFPGE
ncbi:MAG: molybdopterin-dependent oxidoreductase [Anaerolineae bacterium]